MNRRFAFDTRLLAAAMLAAVSAAIVLGVTAPPPSVDVLVAASPAPSGVRVDNLDLSVRSVVDATGLVLAESRDDIGDHILEVPLEAGSPLLPDILSSPAEAAPLDMVGVELSSDAALHGALIPGDVVDVYVADPVRRVAGGVQVIAVFSDGGTLGMGDIGLLLEVDDILAPAVIEAAASRTIHLVRRGS